MESPGERYSGLAEEVLVCVEVNEKKTDPFCPLRNKVSLDFRRPAERCHY